MGRSDGLPGRLERPQGLAYSSAFGLGTAPNPYNSQKTQADATPESWRRTDPTEKDAGSEIGISDPAKASAESR